MCTVFCVNNTVRTVGVLAVNSGNYFLQAIHVLGALVGYMFVVPFCKGVRLLR